MLKTCGYLVSTISVLLLGFVSWSGASGDPLLFTCLIVGMLASVLGMFLRWSSYRDERRQRHGAITQLASSSRERSVGDAKGPSRDSAVSSFPAQR